MTVSPSPTKIFRYIDDYAKTHFLANQKKWTSTITIGGSDYNELGDTKEEAKHKLVKRILDSKYLTSKVPV